MKPKYSLLILFCMITGLTYAQTIVTGKVIEISGNSGPLSNVFIRNINNKKITLTDDNGNFQINATVNQTLIFSKSGYVSDTLFITDLKPKRVQLPFQGVNLREVTIKETTTPFNPREEYPDVYEKSKFALSPSRIFGKESRDARRLKRYFDSEEQQRQVDAIYTKTFVAGIVPLKGAELDNFMTMYRPSLSFVKASSQQTLTVYVNDSYKSFMALPKEKRDQSPLTN